MRAECRTKSVKSCLQVLRSLKRYCDLDNPANPERGDLSADALILSNSQKPGETYENHGTCSRITSTYSMRFQP
ncbi:protein of unknown function [Methylocaldum szegediense]|uniref:Uncharacterized protein n=1 Tax=Methylocaldum szegediense TaxID=73780 RepID=A0ABN8X5V1_9GAMM|nr:protein of unknown function [Methylocaldum szegediense]